MESECQIYVIQGLLITKIYLSGAICGKLDTIMTILKMTLLITTLLIILLIISILITLNIGDIPYIAITFN